MDNYISGIETTISYSDLTPEKFNQTMQQHGCVLIKNVFAANEVSELKSETLDLFYIIKNLQHNNLVSENNQKYLGGGHPAGILPSLDSLESVLNKPHFIDCLRQYFKKDTFVVNVESTGIRRCDPHHWKNFLPWHQDLFHREDTFITCWLPLMKIDAETAGLDLVPKKATVKINEQDDGLDVAYNGKGLSDEMLNEKLSTLRWRPEMDIGDILIFDPYCPHRTSYDEKFNIERYSIDIRIHPKDCVPDATWKDNVIQLPPDLSKQKPPREKRALFQLRHLVSLDLPTPMATAPTTPSSNKISAKRWVKGLISKLSGATHV
jgi:hypothetical protein